MENLIVKDPAKFTDILRKLIPEDRGHADVLNPFFEAFLNNDIFLKKLAEKIQEKSNEHIEDESIHVTSQDKQKWSEKADTATATQVKDGLESAADKKKLDGIKEGAEVNQNAFSNVKVGSITVSASGKTATFILEAGSNVTIDADNANKKIVITANKDGGNADKLDGYHAEHFAAADHGHDGRYYTKTESDNLLNQKAASNHNHNGGKYLAGQGVNGGYSFINDGAYDTGMFSDSDGDLYFMQNGQKWYASHSDHEHDGRYYTESEVNNFLSVKAAADHGHDGRYYTKTESDNLLNQKANSSHSHNGIYYTKEEVNNSLNGKASLNHTHSYASANHNHDGTYLPYFNGLSSGYVRMGQKENTTIGKYATAEGRQNISSNEYSHAEGRNNTASNDASHAEGAWTTSSGHASHAEGASTTSSGHASHAEGWQTDASGDDSHAEGGFTDATGQYAHAEGYYTIASNYASHACGMYNVEMSNNTYTGHLFVIGNGSHPMNSEVCRSNAFSVLKDGQVKAASTITASTAADYAEFFEWLDGNPNKEDRVGYFVTLDGTKIRIANSQDNYILGIISGQPFVLGNGDCDTWTGMYLRDEFNRVIQEPAPKLMREEVIEEMEQEVQEQDKKTGKMTVKIVKERMVTGFVEKEVLDENGNLVYEGTRAKLNPEYNPKKKYISRFDRSEWDAVGMLGVLSVYDDGTCEVNGYCKCNDSGIATISKCGYRVIERVAENVVKVVFR